VPALIKVMICPSLLCSWIYTDALGFPSIRSLAAVLINFKASCVKGQAQILTPLILADYPQKAAAKASGAPAIISAHPPGANPLR